MEVWTILIDHNKGKYEPIFKDRLYLVGMNQQVVLEYLKSAIKNFEQVVHKQLEIDCDGWVFYEPNKFDMPDSVLKVKLVDWSVKGDIVTYLDFRLILLDLYETYTAQSGIPVENISEIRKAVAEYFPPDNY